MRCGGGAIRRSRGCKVKEHPSTDSPWRGHRRRGRITCGEQQGRPSGEAAVVARREGPGWVLSSRKRSDSTSKIRRARLARGGCASGRAGDPGTQCPRCPRWQRWSRRRIEQSGGPGKRRTKKGCQQEKESEARAKDTRDGVFRGNEDGKRWPGRRGRWPAGPETRSGWEGYDSASRRASEDLESRQWERRGCVPRIERRWSKTSRQKAG